MLSPVARASVQIVQPPAPGSRLRASSRPMSSNPPPAAFQGCSLLGPDGQKSAASPYGLQDFEADLRECVLSPGMSLSMARHQPRRWGACIGDSLQTRAPLQESEDGSPRMQPSSTELAELFTYWSSQIVEQIECKMSRQEGLIRELMRDLGQLSYGASELARYGPSKDNSQLSQQEPTDESHGSVVSQIANETKHIAPPKSGKLPHINLDQPATEIVQDDIVPAVSARALPRNTRSPVPLGQMLKQDLAGKRASQQELEALAATPITPDCVAGTHSDPVPHRYPMVDRCVRHRYFERLSCFMSGFNILTYGIQVQLVSTRRQNESEDWIRTMLVCFTLFFLWELVMRILAQRWAFIYGREKAWNLLDTIVLVASVFEVVGEFTQSLNNLPFRSWQIAKVMRVFRAFKLFRSLRLLVFSIMSTVQQLFWTMALILGLLFTFAIVFTEATTTTLLQTQQKCPDQPYDVDMLDPDVALICSLNHLYGDLALSMLTLSMAMTDGMDWADCYGPLRDVSFMLAMFFLLFLSFARLAVMNVVTAIFCQNAIDNAHIQREEKVQRYQDFQEMLMRDLREIFETIDLDGDGHLTLAEFERGLRDPNVQHQLESMELTIQEARMLFSLLDSAGSNAIEIEDFVLGCMQLRGGARNFDVALLRLECQYICDFLFSTEDERSSLGPPPRAVRSSNDDGDTSSHCVETKRPTATSIESFGNWILGHSADLRRA